MGILSSGDWNSCVRQVQQKGDQVRVEKRARLVHKRAKDKEILNSIFEILETEKMLHGVELTLVPRRQSFRTASRCEWRSSAAVFRAVEKRHFSRYGG
jgi:hypothetical protein